MKRRQRTRGQVWIETMMYVLIGLALIALTLTFVMPKINQKRDTIVIDQAIASLNVLDDKIITVIETGQSNKRIVEMNMRRGKLSFDVANNQIILEIDGLTKPYGEPNLEIDVGRVKALSSVVGKTSTVKLTLAYGNGVDLTFKDNNVITEEFTRSLTPYRFSIENKGVSSNGGTAPLIDIGQIS